MGIVGLSARSTVGITWESSHPRDDCCSLGIASYLLSRTIIHEALEHSLEGAPRIETSEEGFDDEEYLANPELASESPRRCSLGYFATETHHKYEDRMQQIRLLWQKPQRVHHCPQQCPIPTSHPRRRHQYILKMLNRAQRVQIRKLVSISDFAQSAFRCLLMMYGNEIDDLDIMIVSNSVSGGNILSDSKCVGNGSMGRDCSRILLTPRMLS